MIFYLLNKKQKVIKAISSKKTIEAHFIEGINQANQLVLSLPLKERLTSNIFYALFEKPDSTEYLMFKLISEDVQNDRVTYNGVDAAYDELKGYGYIKDIRPVKRTAKEILQRVLQDTRWEVGYIDSTNPVDTNFYYQTYLECIQQIVQLFNLEVTFTYGFDTKYQQITSRKVNLYLQQGRRTGKRFEYGSNLLEVTREENSQNIVTALVGRGKGEEKYDDNTGEATDGYGRRISFSDVVWSKANGDPVDKPAGQEYVEDPEATKIFGYDDGKPRTGIIVFDDIEDPVELLKATWTSLKSSDHPKVSFKAQVTDVGNLQLGDTIAIIRHEISIEYFTRVFKVDHDLLNKNNSTIEMGDDMSDRSLYSYISNVDTTAKQAVQDANQAAVAAGFKSKNYYSTTKPAIADDGDNLWLNLGNGQFEHWVWHNHQWEFINSTKDLDNVKQNVTEAQREIINAKAEIIKNHEASNEAISSLSKTVTGLVAKVDDSVNKSEIEQLSNQINLKVSKGNIIGQLNIEAGSTLIQNKKLYLDADSVVFSGKAFIPDAAITNISADKINAGTLDAGKINVINLNADNIVAGTLSGKNINMNLITGRVVFTAGRFYNQDETFDINIDENYIRSEKRVNWLSGKAYCAEENNIITELKNGEITISEPKYTFNDQNEEKKYKYTFLGRENILKIASSKISTDFFGLSETNVTGIISTQGFVICPEKSLSKTSIWDRSIWNNEFIGLIINGYNNDYGLELSGGETGVQILGGPKYNSSTGSQVPGISIGLRDTFWNGNPGIDIYGSSIHLFGEKIDIGLGNGPCTINGNTYVWGTFGCIGTKNAIVPTSKGMTAINAYETAEYYFGDIGKTKTDKNGQVLIQLDPLFLETVNTSIPYHVFVSPYGNANVWVEQMDQNSFIVKSSKPNIEFSWEIKAKRKGYENHRLEITSKEIPKELIPQYKEKGIM